MFRKATGKTAWVRLVQIACGLLFTAFHERRQRRFGGRIRFNPRLGHGHKPLFVSGVTVGAGDCRTEKVERGAKKLDVTEPPRSSLRYGVTMAQKLSTQSYY